MTENDREIFKSVCVRMSRIGVLSEPEIIVTQEKQLQRYRDMVTKLQARIRFDFESDMKEVN